MPQLRRFSFYGMKAILPIYLTSWLGFTEDAATTIIHTFNFAAYLFTLPGGIMSDSWLGKFKTIFYLSIVYACGSLVLALTSFPRITGNPPHWWGAMIGLTLIVIGTGGIKPCVSSFGGDQFKPTQLAMISVFFSWFYWSINAGSMLSMFITPVLRQNVHCFGEDSCYPLAFGLPAALMVIATVVFVIGYKSYVHVPPAGNGFVQVCKACTTAVREKIRLKRSGTAYSKPSHWVYYARTKFSAAFLAETKAVLAIVALLSPISFFWALYDQQGSRWTYQGMMMETKLGSIDIKPEQMGIINAFLILVLIPAFEYGLYPFMAFIGLRMRAVSKMFWGMILAIVSFVIAAFLQFTIEKRGTFVADPSDPASLMCVEGCVHILWQFPQYFIITCAEVMVSCTGLEFAYSQAPATMKSVCQATWLLTVAAGNLIVIIVTLIDPVRLVTKTYVQAWNFIVWSGILALGTGLFLWVAKGYVYVEDRQPDPELFEQMEAPNVVDDEGNNTVEKRVDDDEDEPVKDEKNDSKTGLLIQ